MTPGTRVTHTPTGTHGTVCAPPDMPRTIDVGGYCITSTPHPGVWVLWDDNTRPMCMAPGYVRLVQESQFGKRLRTKITETVDV